MVKTNMKISRGKKKRQFPLKINKERLYGPIIILIIVVSIITIISLTFFPSSQEGFSELTLLTYNSSEDTYEAENYPFFIYRLRNISIHFIAKNFENKVTYYQLQIKATKLTQNLSTLSPLSTGYYYSMYSNNTYEKILSPATNTEKKESEDIDSHYIWSPTVVILYLNAFIDLMLDGESELKIVFELWKFNTQSNEFQYSGVFTFLELDIRWS